MGGTRRDGSKNPGIFKPRAALERQWNIQHERKENPCPEKDQGHQFIAGFIEGIFGPKDPKAHIEGHEKEVIKFMRETRVIRRVNVRMEDYRNVFTRDYEVLNGISAGYLASESTSLLTFLKFSGLNDWPTFNFGRKRYST